MKWYITFTIKGTRLGIVYAESILHAETQLFDHYKIHNPSILIAWGCDTWITIELKCPVLGAELEIYENR